MADTASAVASDTIDKLAAMTADNTSTRSYLTSVRGEIADLKRQAEAALRGAEAAAAAATQAKNQSIVAKNNAITAAQNAAAARTQLDQLKAKQSSYAADLAVQRKNEASDLASARAESSRLQAILVEQARKARIAEQKRLAKLRAERDAKRRAERAKAAAAKKRGQVYVPKTPPPVQSDPTPSNYLSYPAIGPDDVRVRHAVAPGAAEVDAPRRPRLGHPVRHAGVCRGAGRRLRAGWRASGSGNRVVIDHGIHRGVDLATTYNHLTSIVKFSGRSTAVSSSATPARRATRPAATCTSSVYENGTPVDPRKWL